MNKALHFTFCTIVLFALAQNNCFSQDTAKIVGYNILDYGANSSDTAIRHPYFRTVIQSINPDILVVEEILSQNAVNVFLNKVMNLAGAGTYQAGVFIDGYDTDNEVFYKPSKFVFISNTPIHTDLRDINEALCCSFKSQQYNCRPAAARCRS
jgi:esterase/lipase superfamily enzyme